MPANGSIKPRQYRAPPQTATAAFENTERIKRRPLSRARHTLLPYRCVARSYIFLHLLLRHIACNMTSLGTLVRCSLSRPRLQPLWERLHRLALLGMGCGIGGALSTSGEEHVLHLLARLMCSGAPPTVFDVGANVGDYASAVLDLLKGHVSVFCFEPSPSAFAQLAKLLSKHKNVQLFNCGLGKSEGASILYSDCAGSGLSSLHKRRLDHFHRSMNREERVQITTLDDFCSEHGVQHIHLLKLDVEGSELDVLAGAARMIGAGAIDLIQFEFGGCNIDSRTYFQDFYYLLNTDFNLFRILPSGLAAVKGYRESYEVFLTTNYLAVDRKLHERVFSDGPKLTRHLGAKSQKL